MDFKNKRILITAGPTWVPIDTVRVISNIATGRTGILLAEKLQNLGAQVTLLLGGAEACCLNKKIKLLRFRFFDELKDKIIQELKYKKYDIVIHSAAVSDYTSSKVYSGKIKSGIKNLRLSFVPTEKIIDLIKRIDNSIILVGFKFETGVKKNLLIKKTRDLIKAAKLDLAVSCRVNKNQYQAYIINDNRVDGPFYNKNILTRKLIKVINKNEIQTR